MDSLKKKQLLIAINNPVIFEPIAKDAFDAADKNKNGKIEKKELYQCMKDVASGLEMSSPDKKALEKLFFQLDIDHNGILDYNEFKVYVKDNMNKIIKEKL
jgi:Ca2+-binding EF-hand superfamily protein